MNNTHTRAMKASAFAGFPVAAWACRAADLSGLGAPEYRADLDAPIAVQGFPQDLDPLSSPS